MASGKTKVGARPSSGLKPANKERRKLLYVKSRRAADNARQDERRRRRKEEDKDPRLREERLRKNVPLTIERKRTWDAVDRDTGDGLGLSVDVERLKRQKAEDDMAQADEGIDSIEGDSAEEIDSMIDSASDSEDGDNTVEPTRKPTRRTATERATSPVQSTASTNLDLAPENLALRFPSLFNRDLSITPKILITTSLNSSLHKEAELLTNLFPFSIYIPRSAHRYSHKFSIREISSFATNRNYTTVIVLKEDLKRPTGLTIVDLPHGPTFHFSISNWMEGKKLPGHGKPTQHYPELILNNFRTPLGLLTAHLFRTLFPVKPEFQGRQVVTLHNQRDYIFLRRHRYVFREKREREKNVVGPDGNDVKGVEGIRAGLQELGPRFTLKLRRVDKGIQRASGQEWEWKGGMEKVRTKFQL